MKSPSLTAAFLALSFLASCRSSPLAPRSAVEPARAHATAIEPASSAAAATPAAENEPSSSARRSTYTLVLIRSGPKSGQLSAEENQRAFQGHFDNMGRMAREGQLVLAGPYGEERHAPDLRGIFVLDTADRREAEEWAGTDPTTRAGVFRLEFHELATDAPLRRALAEDLAWRARMEAEGKNPAPGEGARGYVLLTAEDAELARRELEPLCTMEGGVFLLGDVDGGEVDGGRILALLDAASAAEARVRFAPQLENLGACTLDDWFGSNQFARLPELAR
jgi:uncharacterized protein YciI